MKMESDSVRTNIKFVRSLWGDLPRTVLFRLRKLTRVFGLSVALGDVQLIDGRWYVTHAGLLRIAQRSRCRGIETSLQKNVSDPIASRWVFKATVYKSSGSRGFVGYGDADPSNTSLLVRGAEMSCRDPRRQPGSPKSLWNRALQCRRTRFILSLPPAPPAST
jgi:hypothetical protein